MAQATFAHGNPVMVDHTPSGADVTAGDIVVVGDETRICHRTIEDGELGALAAPGGNAVYDVLKDTGTGTAITVGDQVYWDDTNNVATATAGSHKQLGIVVEAASDDDTTVRVRHTLF